MDVKPEILKSGLFRDRREAGRLLAAKLTAYATRPEVIVLALPRGGVPVAYEVARSLGAPLDDWPHAFERQRCIRDRSAVPAPPAPGFRCHSACKNLNAD